MGHGTFTQIVNGRSRREAPATGPALSGFPGGCGTWKVNIWNESEEIDFTGAGQCMARLMQNLGAVRSKASSRTSTKQKLKRLEVSHVELGLQQAP
jgi:hypothetical protein